MTSETEFSGITFPSDRNWSTCEADTDWIDAYDRS